MWPRSSLLALRGSTAAPPPPPPPPPPAFSVSISSNAVGIRSDGSGGSSSSVTTNTVSAVIDNMGVPGTWTYNWIVSAPLNAGTTINGQGTPSVSFTRTVSDGENVNSSISVNVNDTSNPGRTGLANSGLAFVSTQ